MALNVNIKSLESFSVIIKIIVQRMKCLFVQIEASHIAHHNKPWSPYPECRMGVLLFILHLFRSTVGHWCHCSNSIVTATVEEHPFFCYFHSIFDLPSPDFVHFVPSHFGCLIISSAKVGSPPSSHLARVGIRN